MKCVVAFLFHLTNFILPISSIPFLFCFSFMVSDSFDLNTTFKDKVHAVIGYYSMIDKLALAANHFVSDSKRSTMLMVLMDTEYSSKVITHLYEVLDNLDTDDGTYRYATTGMRSVEVDIISAISTDLFRMVLTSLPVALLLLVIILKSLSLMLIPITTLALATVFSFATMYPFAEYMVDVASFNPPIMLSLIVAMCIDYSLFLLTRYKEEIRIGKTNEEAISEMMRSSGKIVITSGSILFFCFFGICFSPVSIVYTFGMTATVAIFYAIVLSLVITPVMLYIGKSFFMSPLPCVASCRMQRSAADDENQPLLINSSDNTGLASDTQEKDTDPKEEEPESISQGTCWNRFKQTTVKYFTTITTPEKVDEADRNSVWYKIGSYLAQTRYTIAAIIIVLILTVPVIVFVKDFQITLDDSMCETKNGRSTIGMEELQKGFSPGIIALYHPVLRAKTANSTIMSNHGFDVLNDYISTITKNVSGIDPKNVLAISFAGGKEIPYPIAQRLLRGKGKMGKMYTKLKKFIVSEDERTSFITLTTSFDPKHNITNFVERLREVSDEFSATSDFEVVISSMYCDMQDCVDIIYQKMPIILIVTGVIAIVIILLIFRYLLIPFRTVITLFIVLGFTYGLATLAYVYRGFNWAGITGAGALYWFVPVCTFGVVIGITLDYDVFLFARIAEYHEKGFDTPTSVKRGYQKGISVIFFAGLIMASAFAGLLPSQIQALEQVSFIWTAAVLVCTFVLCTLFMPAVISS